MTSGQHRLHFRALSLMLMIPIIAILAQGFFFAPEAASDAQPTEVEYVVTSVSHVNTNEREERKDVQRDDPLIDAANYTDRIDARFDHIAARQARIEARQAARAEERAEAAAAPSRSEPNYATGNTVWDDLAECESGGNWAYNGSSGYDGGLQFLPSTWTSMALDGYPAYAWQATREQQIAVAERTLAASSWSQQWPACSAELGLY